MHPPRTVILATILGVLLSACTPSTGPSSTPTPAVPMCTPEFGGDAYPCTQAEREQTLARDARYADAERVYREYAALDQQELVERKEVPSTELMSLLAASQHAAQPDLRKGQLEMATFSGRYTVVWVRPARPRADLGGSLALLVCRDRSEWLVALDDGSQAQRTPQALLVQFEVIGPRIAEIEPVDEASCA